MNYTKIDLDNWARGRVFRHFMDDLRCVMSMTVDVDVTPLLAFVRAEKLKFYPAMMWAVGRVLNAHAEFKYSLDAEGALIQWDFISPYYADFHPDSEEFVKLTTEYAADLSVFHARFLADRERFQALKAFDQRDIPPNTFDVSCLPWVRYKSFDLHIFDSGTYLAPVVTWGKYESVNGRAVLPLSMNIHHAVADGYHLSRFFLELQALIDGLAES